ncbi:MAG: bifunctional phosphopantothenoylcysteine decarboxylase/phosphopantothenate--cysteine ligase CoaBC, partial [Dongiaceae bacterium]
MAPLARILLIVSGGIAAYKSLELIRRGRDRGLSFRVILTRGGAEFVTPLSFSSLSGEKVYQELFSLTDEAEMGHIRLSREADLVVVAPASADLMAKMAHGLADDLASTALLATDKPVLVAPAMNVMMWANPATQANIATLKARGIHVVGPGSGDLACGEEGSGRLSEPHDILDAIEKLLGHERLLSGLKALVTSGPTYEPIDPVRYIANRSSGKQGHAVAAALARLGAETLLVSGPTHEADPAGVAVRHVETAAEMLAACEAALPVDVAVCAAAVADWRPAQPGNQKLKKNGATSGSLELTANPDILATLSQSKKARPRLMIGFAAETEQVVKHAEEKLKRKGCDWIL